MRKFVLAAAGVAAALAIAASPAVAAKEKDKTIVDKVVEISGASGFDSNPVDFDILREAVVATGLVDRLDGQRQLTVFAPTDQAFLDLTGASTEEEAFSGVAALGLPAVEDILRYHLAPGRRAADQVVNARLIPTLLQGEFLTKDRGSTDLVDGAGRTTGIAVPNAASVSNGIIHVIDGVLLPFAL